ncbi:MAG: hypothetical protein PHY12_10880, partial [Eubacteriales bacterium]|nr:hypothetical protein [Eubacteriales bacterium]
LLRAGLQLYFVPKYVTHLPRKATLLRILRMVLEVALIAVPFLTVFHLNINGFFKWITLAVPLCIYATLVTLGCGWLFDRESLLSLFGRAKYLFKRGR